MARTLSRPSFTVTLLALALAACGGGDSAPGPAPVGDTVVVTENGNLQSFNRATPGTLVGSRALSGIVIGETIVGIDYRPANGLLYALGSRGNLYTLEPATGKATFRGEIKAAAGQSFTGLQGSSFAVDFNPVVDRLRVVSNSGQNLRINVDTNEVLADVAVNSAAGAVPFPNVAVAVSGAAYTQSFKGSTATQLYTLDLSQGLLQRMDPPNNGTLQPGVSLGVVATGSNGFDVEARNAVGYAAIRTGAVVSLYRIDLNATANAATKVGDFASADTITGLALVQPE
jgi:hypothetical protein